MALAWFKGAAARAGADRSPRASWRILLALGAAMALTACASAPEDAAVTPAASASAAGGAADPSSREYFEVTVGDRVFFPTDQSGLTADAQRVLVRQAEWLRQNSGRPVLIEGHADERGTREYNIALGARRAESVKSFLIAQGVNPGRLNTVSYGRERPVETCSQDVCWARNRRAVTVPQGN